MGRHSNFAARMKVLTFICLSAFFSFACTQASNVDAPGQGNNKVVKSSSFDETISSLRTELDARRADGVPVPVPADGGGGYTHEQHKQNAKTIYEAGMLYQLTGDADYKEFAASILEDYAELYPTLDLHPKRKENHPAGRLFWQGLNESWWLVYVIQSYDVIRDDLSEEQRAFIENDLIHPMVDFLSEGSPRTFNRIHNHGTWAVAGVGMTGYVLGEPDYVEKALYGLDRSGEGGFIRQIDELFSPDGYYTEGPYYQRYAMMPFILFAQAIEQNDPDRKIFEHKDAVLLKAIHTTVQQSYADKFFPINDAIREKGLNTAELRYGMAIAYDLTEDPTLLSVAERQHPFVPTPEGRALADAIDAGLAEPYQFKSMMFRDGGQGEGGALFVLRSGPGRDDAAVVMKATSQGLGHGHFDRLGFLYYDNGDEIIADYGASRFLNVEPKFGGHYLPENKTWAKQTIAHNTLVVDQASHFDGKWRKGEEHQPTILAFEPTPGASFVAAKSEGAYDDASLTRAIAMVDRPDGGTYIIDVLQGASDAPRTFDMPVHFKGQLIETSLPFKHATSKLEPLGTSSGYQHLWKTSETPVQEEGILSDLSFLIRDQFYTMTFAVDLPTKAFLTRLGANDPDNNLRPEQALVLRGNGSDVSFVSVYERHGRYDSDEEVTIYNGGSVSDISSTKIGEDYVHSITTDYGQTLLILVSENGERDRLHELNFQGQSISWTGPVGLKIIAGETDEKNSEGEE